MLMEGLFLKFQGFRPSNFTRSYLNRKMDALHEEAPYGSTLKAVFTRTDEALKGVVTIRSAVGEFFAVASGTRTKEVTQNLMEQLRGQLNQWKSKRFESEKLIKA